MRSFTIEINGLPQRGLWRLKGDDDLEVRSAYGTACVHLHGRAPEDVAREVIASLVPPLKNAERAAASASDRANGRS